MAESREREDADFYSMFLFSFNYLGESHWTACDCGTLENNLEKSPESALEKLGELASFPIEHCLKDKKIWRDGVSVKDVRIFRVDASDIEKFSSELEKHLVQSIDVLNFKVPVSTL